MCKKLLFITHDSLVSAWVLYTRAVVTWLRISLTAFITRTVGCINEKVHVRLSTDSMVYSPEESGATTLHGPVNRQ